MAIKTLDRVFRSIRFSILRRESGDVSDGELLRAFVNEKEPAAFEAIVRRHGPMVLGVCRRILHDDHDAEDSFQATFLGLVQKASHLSTRRTIGDWLYGVAYHTALKSRAHRRRRRQKTRPMIDAGQSDAVSEIEHRELRRLLDQEISRLPEKHRSAVVLCDLESKTYQQAARLLGWPEGTVAGRLARGRKQLAKRLAARGITLTASGLAALFAQESLAGVPSSLIHSTIRTVQTAALGGGIAAASTHAGILTKEVLQTMFIAKLRIAAAWAVLFAGLGAGGLFLAHQSTGADPMTRAAKSVDRPKVAQSKPAPPDAKKGPILKGNLTDENGRPLSGAKITLYSGLATRWKGQETTTDHQGNYCFDPLETGSMSKNEKDDRWDLYVGMEIRHPTHVEADGWSWRDIQVPRIDRHVEIKDFKMTPGGKLVGHVVDAAGKPVAGLDLRIQSPTPDSVKFGRYATTDKDGTFVLPALFPAEYVVDVNSPKLRYPALGKVKMEAKKTIETSFTFRGEKE